MRIYKSLCLYLRVCLPERYGTWSTRCGSASVPTSAPAISIPWTSNGILPLPSADHTRSPLIRVTDQCVLVMCSDGAIRLTDKSLSLYNAPISHRILSQSLSTPLLLPALHALRLRALLHHINADIDAVILFPICLWRDRLLLIV